MDIHGKSVDMDMDGKFNIHGKPAKTAEMILLRHAAEWLNAYDFIRPSYIKRFARRLTFERIKTRANLFRVNWSEQSYGWRLIGNNASVLMTRAECALSTGVSAACGHINGLLMTPPNDQTIVATVALWFL